MVGAGPGWGLGTRTPWHWERAVWALWLERPRLPRPNQVTMSWDPSMEWNGREYAHPTGEQLAAHIERGVYGVKGELAARLLPPLIELAKSRDQ